MGTSSFLYRYSPGVHASTITASRYSAFRFCARPSAADGHGIATLIGFAFSGYGAFGLARTLPV